MPSLSQIYNVQLLRWGGIWSKIYIDSMIKTNFIFNITELFSEYFDILIGITVRLGTLAHEYLDYLSNFGRFFFLMSIYLGIFKF